MAAIYQWFPGIQGICGKITGENIYGPLSPHMIQLIDESFKNVIQIGQMDTNSTNFADSKTLCFTALFCRENLPTVRTARIIELYESQAPGPTTTLMVGLNTSGHLRVWAKNAALTRILEVTITNNGGSFAGGNLHGVGFVANLDDATKREIWVDGADRTNDPNYVTWETYTDDLIKYSSSFGTDSQLLGFGAYNAIPETYASTANGGTGFGDGSTAYDSLGYISLDNACTLVTPAMFTADGWLRDPGAWEGWYHTQPKLFYGPSFYRQTGSYQHGSLEMNIDNFPVSDYNYTSDAPSGQLWRQSLNCMVNRGIGATL